MDTTREPDDSTKGEMAKEQPDGLDAGGHEPAPPSEDPDEDEARDSIRDAFDDLQALHPDAERGKDPEHARGTQEPAKP